MNKNLVNDGRDADRNETEQQRVELQRILKMGEGLNLFLIKKNQSGKGQR